MRTPLQKVAEFLHRVVQISLVTQKEAGSKLLKDFTKAYESGSGEAPRLIEELKQDVMKFATSFPLPGVPDTVSDFLHPTWRDTERGVVFDQEARGCEPIEGI
jgi:hypothetical protein